MSLARIWFLKALESRQLFSAAVVADASRLIFSANSAGAPSAVQSVTLTNNDAVPVTIAVGGEYIDGADADEFSIPASSSLPIVIQPGTSATVPVQFATTRIGPAGALLHIVTDDSQTPEIDVVLRGLGTKGQFDTLEPSLQWILDTYQIPDNVGASDPTQNILDIVPLKPNDEVTMNLLEKVGPGPVTVDPIAVYTSASSPALELGDYTFGGGAVSRTQAFAVPSSDVQTLNPHVIGSDQFDPGTSIFGLYTQWPGQKNRLVYTEDFRNTWQPDARLKRSMRFYPMKNPDGSTVPNAYVVAVEEATNHDYQDGVFIVQNVRLASPGESPSGLSASPTTARQIFLKWTDNSSNETAYTIDRSVNGGSFLTLATLGPNITKFTDSHLDAGGRYQYRVLAVGTDGVSDYTYSPATLVPVIYDAEKATLAGPIVQNAFKGFSGTGYVAFQNLTGDTLYWQPSVEQTGTATLTFRFANGSTASRPLQLIVNGAVVKSSLAFPTTGAWSTRHTLSVTVTLTAGLNDIILKTIGQGGPNLDYLMVR